MTADKTESGWLVDIQPNESGPLFMHCYEAFTNALIESELELPAGQRTDVLRHTFVSHFIMNGGNLLALQKILGHSTINMTMRYAHLSPDHLQEAALLNPLKKWTLYGHLRNEILN